MTQFEKPTLVAHCNFAYLPTLAIWPLSTGSKLDLVSRRNINWSSWTQHLIGLLIKMAKWQVVEGKHLFKINMHHKCGTVTPVFSGHPEMRTARNEDTPVLRTVKTVANYSL